jgi:tRNA nucleotidyltransferase (CCA-adding enzyme)
VRWAALIHDLGKALTPDSEWPRHFGHEKKGIKPIRQLCQRLKCPNDPTSLALLSSEFHTHIHRAFELRPETLLKVFDQLDVWRKPERFEEFLLVCIADARGRTGFEDCAYPQADYVREALTEAQKITARDVIAEGVQGPAIRAALAEKRTASLTAWKKEALIRFQ